MATYSDREINAILLAGKSPRCERMEAYEKYWNGTIYEGRPGFLDQSVDVPLLERAPCIVYPIVRNSIQSILAFSMGEGKFPRILSMSSEDDTSFDERLGLSKDESVVIDGLCKKIDDQARFPAVMQQLAETALSRGTAVPVISLDRGRIKVSQIDPKYCTPTMDEKNPNELASLEVSYRYVEDYFSNTEKKWHKRVLQYRRVIDRQVDTTFVPVEVKSVNDYPIPRTPDAARTFTHNFGFCPVHWYACRATVEDCQEIDGRPIHWGLASQLDALHFSYSQRHRAAMYTGDPQYWEVGVTSEDMQTMGRSAAAAQPTSNNPQGKAMANGWAFGTGGGSKPMRKKGPGAVWQYENPEAKVGMMTLPGDALKAVDLHANDLRVKLCEALGVTFIDPAQLKGTGDISGKTLAFIFANQIANCNSFREDFGRKCLLPVLNLIFRVILAKGAGGGLYLAGVKESLPILKRFQQPVGWFEPNLRLAWGDYFLSSAVDEATETAAAIEALQAGIIVKATAVEHIKSIFQIENTSQYLLELERERQENEQQELAKAQVLSNMAVAEKAAGGGVGGGKSGAGRGKANGKKFKLPTPAAQQQSAKSNPVPKRESGMPKKSYSHGVAKPAGA